MADENVLTDEQKQQLENEKIKREGAIQDKTLNPGTTTQDIEDSSSALDRIASEKSKENEEKQKQTAVVEEKDTPPAPDDEAAKKAAEEKAVADKKAADEKKIADDAALEKTKDIFKDTPSLPQGASPKSSEAFASVKLRAAQEISARDAKIIELETKLKDAEQKVSTSKPLTEEIERELKDLRSFRDKLDVEADPKFKEFDKTISQSQEFIYAQLRKSPAITDATIEKIKALGGPEKVNLTKLFESINDPTIQRIVESKVADIEMASYNREMAIKSAKENIGQYVTERSKAATEAATAHNKATRVELDKILAPMAFLNPKAIDPKADDTAKKSTEAHNQFITDLRQQVDAAAQDDSPFMRGVMLAGMAKLIYLQKVHEGALAELKTIKDTHAKALEAKAAENKALSEKLEAIKASSTSRLRESGAPSGGKPAVTPGAVDLRTTGDALDEAARQVQAERQARGK